MRNCFFAKYWRVPMLGSVIRVRRMNKLPVLNAFFRSTRRPAIESSLWPPQQRW